MTTTYTPMIQQYLGVKADYPDAFLFFRLGDFYEMFFEDAVLASRELEITLTKRAGGGEDKIPMCGVPYHSASQYIRKLIEKGYKVAICEQVEDPKEAKGVVRREVVQVITPGTLMEDSMLKDRENNFILFLAKHEDRFALVACDLSTGEVSATQASELQTLAEEAQPYNAAEIVLGEGFSTADQQQVKSYCPQSSVGFTAERGQRHAIPISKTDEVTSQKEAEGQVENLLSAIPKQQQTGAIIQCVQLLQSYLEDTQKRSVGHLQPVQLYQTHSFLHLDPSSRRNLELTETIRAQSKKGSLLWLLDETSTAMGGRLIKKWIQRPLMDQKLIDERLDAVQLFLDHALEREELMQLLDEVYDLERLAGRVSYGNVNPRDVVQLRRSLKAVPEITALLNQLPGSYIQEKLSKLDPCTELLELLEGSVLDEPPISVKDGGIFKQGYHEELDRLLEASRNGKQWIADLEATEREKTGIKSLKVGFNKVFGYYIEITRANLHALHDERYERKQTLANAERYITPELKEKEALILEANDRLMVLEYELFVELRLKINQYLLRLQALAEGIAQLDVLGSFARVSEKFQYTRPHFNSDRLLSIEDGRHPVVEKVLGESTFVANDVRMDTEARQILLLTGPNMAGKSTYMRQTALIVVMAQIGCFVSAKRAKLPVFDQIFTRIGAADDLVGGQSTFMVEMMETKRAITKATADSLILLDEIGRGTSTYDGMSLAQAVVEYIQEHVQAKTLFSTHYHELTGLEQQLAGLTNIHVACSEREGRVIFLHKVREGKADRSYGIHVAQLAEMPSTVIRRAQEILSVLEGQNQVASSLDERTDQGWESGSSSENEVRNPEKAMQSSQEKQKQSSQEKPLQTTQEKQKQSSEITAVEQMQFQFGLEGEEQQVLSQLKETNLLTMTPLAALNLLYELQEQLKSSKK
ncbi:DNA mismatch repair protein MutS [Bacillus horti]|uniref:DNA mismatch repair protein MutS n=1 Tax=Caldalkalibacillus horti TaxID=77523 RepID=A0ABT9VW14_9BACI|nr:DNA mismatch repair protein MutS [Bacillus horti]MDQ0164820.1 DNA mismatch repair protein MutS [Bacillus horti]